MSIAHAPAAKRDRAQDADTVAEARIAVDSWRARARRLLHARADAVTARVKQLVRAAATAATDSGIAALERLRQRADSAEQPQERSGRERMDARAPAQRAGRTAAEVSAKRAGSAPAQASAKRAGGATAEAPAPKPRRRLRGLLVYLGVMLAGSMGGMALAYDLLAQLLERQSAEITRQEIKLSKYSKSVAELNNKLDQQQAKQAEAEARVAATLTENEKKLGELQAQRVAAESRLASALAGHAGNEQRQEDAGRAPRAGARGVPPAWTKSGDCTLGSGDIRSVLKGCIAGMERK